MRVLIIGLGSIANKHLAALRQLVPEVRVWALRSCKSSNEVDGVHSVYNWDDVPSQLDFAMICNPTSEHYQAIEKALEFQVPLFIEKPPLMSLIGSSLLLKKVEKKGISTYTAFNFRFHPVIQWLKENLVGKRVFEVQAYCGSYLPDWRPGRDYRTVYSAQKELGGGVHLDLIHELDYLIWLFGEPEKTHSFLNRISELEISTNDIAHYWLAYKKFNISILLNYYRKDAKRHLEIVMEDDTWTADLLDGIITSAEGDILFEDHRPLTDTYRAQMEYFLSGFKNDQPYMNNLAESIKTLAYCLDDHGVTAINR